MINIVVDFVGFDFEGQCIIKEFAVARILDKSIEVEDQILIDTTTLPINSNELVHNNEFYMFYNRTSIQWHKRSDHTREDIIAKMKSLRHHNIYVRDKIHADFLANYLNLSINSFNSLSDLTDFNPYEDIRLTNCRNHQSRKSYCVKNNVMFMAEWLKEKLKEFSEPNIRLAVVDYIGSDDDTVSDNYKITDLRVYCFDNNGTVIINKLITSASSHFIRNVSDEQLQRHKQRYSEKYAVDYVPSQLENMAIINQLKKILLDNKIEFIFVEIEIMEHHLLELLGLPFNIFNLYDYGYVIENRDINDVNYLEKSIYGMVDFVIKKQLYKIIRQQNEIIEISDDENME